MKHITPRFTATVALPSEVKIPVNVAIAAQWPRVFRLIHGQAIPVGVIEFMLADARYRNWFAGDPLAGIGSRADTTEAPDQVQGSTASPDQVQGSTASPDQAQGSTAAPVPPEFVEVEPVAEEVWIEQPDAPVITPEVDPPVKVGEFRPKGLKRKFLTGV